MVFYFPLKITRGWEKNVTLLITTDHPPTDYSDLQTEFTFLQLKMFKVPRLLEMQ